MSQALYRKYRPAGFAEVIGQGNIKTILRNALVSGNISHAYLFTGPRGVGKTTIARIMAKAVNCGSLQDGEPCMKCENCAAISAGTFLDLIEIDAASYTGVDNIRDVIEHVRFSPSRGKYKVFIIDEVHMLSKAAFNALLKTLEEPPGHAIFILATTEIHKVPATIISRSQRHDFKRVSRGEIEQLLDTVLRDSKADLEEGAKKLVARAADGSFRDALSILDQLLSFGQDSLSLEQTEAILGISRLSAHQDLLGLLAGLPAANQKIAGELVSGGMDLTQFMRDFLEYLRLVLGSKLGIAKISELGLGNDEAEELRRQAEAIDSALLLKIVKKSLETYRETKLSPVQELPLLNLLMEFASASAAGQPRAQNPVQGREDTSRESAEVNTAENLQPPEGAQSSIELGLVVDKWSDVLSRVKEYNHSLLSSLRLGRLANLEKDMLVLSFPYSFHKDTIALRKNRIIVEQVLEDVFGAKFQVKAVLERELEQSDAGSGGQTSSSGNDLLNEAVRILGK